MSHGLSFLEGDCRRIIHTGSFITGLLGCIFGGLTTAHMLLHVRVSETESALHIIRSWMEVPVLTVFSSGCDISVRSTAPYHGSQLQNIPRGSNVVPLGVGPLSLLRNCTILPKKELQL